MKTRTRNIGRSAVLVLSAVGLAWSDPVSLQAAEQGSSPTTGTFRDKMEQWQNEMSEKFRDTWESLRGDRKDQPVATAAVDLREDNDRYTLRLNLPDRDVDKVEIKLEGDTLRIVSPASEKTGRYEQSVALSGVDSSAELKIERKPKDSMIVVTVPKSPAVANAKPSLTRPDPGFSQLSEWERGVFTRMETMQREMDRVFDEAFREFRAVPEYRGFFDEPRFGSSFDLKEEGDDYVVRAYLPDRDMRNISVTVEDRTLKIEAKEQETTKREDEFGTSRGTRKAAYSQLLTLPGPVQGDKMQVDKKEGMLVVTLPKAK